MLSGYWTLEYNCWTKLLIKVCELCIYFRYIVCILLGGNWISRINLWPAANDWQILLRNVVCTAQNPALEVYVSQLIRYSRVCCSFNDFLDRRFLLVKLKSSLRKFYGCYHDLVKKYFCHKWSRIIVICSFIVIKIRSFPH